MCFYWKRRGPDRDTRHTVADSWGFWCHLWLYSSFASYEPLLGSSVSVFATVQEKKKHRSAIISRSPPHIIPQCALPLPLPLHMTLVSSIWAPRLHCAGFFLFSFLTSHYCLQISPWPSDHRKSYLLWMYVGVVFHRVQQKAASVITRHLDVISSPNCRRIWDFGGHLHQAADLSFPGQN